MKKLFLALAVLAASPSFAQPSAAATKLQALLYQIDNMYVDSVDDKKLVEKAIVSMLVDRKGQIDRLPDNGQSTGNQWGPR